MASVSVFDVASFILREQGSMTAMKLQKLVYYSQAWSLVWDEEPLFSERIEAWANGPVVRELFEWHRGQFMIDSILNGDPDRLDKTQEETVLGVLEYYGPKPSQWLSDLTHLEDPWREARAGISEDQRGFTEITHAALAEYYESLESNDFE